jgi:oxygen-independent coproporphyrinogen-3 oxidase
MHALKKQLAFELERFEATKGCIETLFIGGGTPSTIAPEYYAPLFELLSPYLSDTAEITTEANPNSATLTWLEGMRALGVNRISFGVQSFHAAKLKALGRAHSPVQATEAVLAAKEAGLAHISLDLIYNYRGDTEMLLGSDIDTAFSLPIDHLSAYELTIENNTPFARTPQARQENDDLAFFVANQIISHGFDHYEISNFGRYQSRHNKGYWELKDYIGAGAGAVGFRKDRRFYPVNDIEHYIASPFQTTQEILSADALLTETIFLGLRSRIGIAKAALPDVYLQRASLLVTEHKLTEDATRFYNPNLFLADALALFIMG